jgi:hypothetical protein
VPTLRLDHAGGSTEVCVERFDLSPLPKATRTDEGFLRAPATRVARIGLQEYRRKDGTWQRELRLPEHVFEEESLASLDGKPIVHRHPESKVDASNARSLARGAGSSPRRDGDFLVADLTIYDADTIRAVERGDSEVSLGYTTVLVPIEGGVYRKDGDPFDGTRADFLQTRIRHNHFALLPRGRANEGTTDRPVRLRLDGEGNQLPADEGREDTMDEEIIINGQKFKVPAAVAAHMKAESKRADEAEKAFAEADDKAKSAEKKAGEQAARADEAEKKLQAAEQAKKDEAETGKQAARFALLKQAEQVTKKDAAELVKLADADLKKAIIQTQRPELKLDGKDAAYIDAAFDMLPKQDSARALRVPAQTTRTDSNESPLAKAYADRAKRLEPKEGAAS